jgi:hypothetical protein
MQRHEDTLRHEDTCVEAKNNKKLIKIKMKTGRGEEASA